MVIPPLTGSFKNGGSVEWHNGHSIVRFWITVVSRNTSRSFGADPYLNCSSSACANDSQCERGLPESVPGLGSLFGLRHAVGLDVSSENEDHEFAVVRRRVAPEKAAP